MATTPIEQQAQEYADNTMRTNYPSVPVNDFFKGSILFTAYDIQQAYIDGYTAHEQSMWRSVEDELPEEDGAYLILTTDKEIEIFVWEDGEWLASGYTVAYWRKLPSLPDTNTEKI